MIDNYVKRFGFIYNPFHKETNEFFIENANYKEIASNLDYVIQTRGIALITGEPGCGKTSSLRKYIQTLPKHLYKFIYISMSTLTVREFLIELASQFGISGVAKKVSLVKEIKNSISVYADQKKILPVIILDEANYLSNQILNDLKMLLNFEMDSKNKAVLILCGLKNLNSTLDLAIHQPLSQRITARVDVEELTEKESKLYIETKIEKAGSSLNYFPPESIQAVINGSGGVPRIIDKIMDKALMLADKTERNIVSDDIIKAAIKTI